HHLRAHARSVLRRAVEISRHGAQVCDGPAPDLTGIDFRESLSHELEVGPLGRGAHADQADRAASNLLVGIDLDADRGARDREVAVTAGELLDREARAPAPDRDAHTDE